MFGQVLENFEELFGLLLDGHWRFVVSVHLIRHFGLPLTRWKIGRGGTRVNGRLRGRWRVLPVFVRDVFGLKGVAAWHEEGGTNRQRASGLDLNARLCRINACLRVGLLRKSDESVNLFLSTTIAIVNFQLHVVNFAPSRKVVCQSLISQLNAKELSNLINTCAAIYLFDTSAFDVDSIIHMNFSVKLRCDPFIFLNTHRCRISFSPKVTFADRMTVDPPVVWGFDCEAGMVGAVLILFLWKPDLWKLHSKKWVKKCHVFSPCSLLQSWLVKWP